VDLSGSRWTTSALYLQGISLARRNNEWHHFDPLGTAQVITNSSAQVVSNNLYDVFGVLRHPQGVAQTPWRWVQQAQAEEGLLAARGGYLYARTQHGHTLANMRGHASPLWGRRFRIDRDCLRECFFDFIVGFGLACTGALLGAGKLCAGCVATALLSCAVSPPSCGMALGLCNTICGPGVVQACIGSGFLAGVGNLLICYRSCVRDKERGFVSVSVYVGPSPTLN
jgi:hypothetical protein